MNFFEMGKKEKFANLVAANNLKEVGKEVDILRVEVMAEANGTLADLNKCLEKLKMLLDDPGQEKNQN